MNDLKSAFFRLPPSSEGEAYQHLLQYEEQ